SCRLCYGGRSEHSIHGPRRWVNQNSCSQRESVIRSYSVTSWLCDCRAIPGHDGNGQLFGVLLAYVGMRVHHALAPNTASAFNNLLGQHFHVSIRELILFSDLRMGRTDNLIGRVMAGIAVATVYKRFTFSNQFG